MWSKNLRNATINVDEIDVFKIYNSYENIDYNISINIFTKRIDIYRGNAG